MGWFWATGAQSPSLVAPHPMADSTASPPAGCPMHKPAPSSSFPSQNSPQATRTGSCPVNTPNEPVTASKPSTLSKINPLNFMPSNLSQSRAQNQTIHLPTERTTSSIPRGDTGGNWEYPSPQQMYNALMRKGYEDTPQDAVESMVEVHNFLNEGAWIEIEQWEKRFSRGLAHGWEACKNGEQAYWTSKYARDEDNPRPKLIRFHGRPNELTPKARIYDFLGRMFPASYGGELPFDRHDWYVQRQVPTGQTQEVRYVIDYYSGPPEPTGEPVFYLDVRPAVDGPTAAAERMLRWGGDVWHRASGAKVRESKE